MNEVSVEVIGGSRALGSHAHSGMRLGEAALEGVRATVPFFEALLVFSDSRCFRSPRAAIGRGWMPLGLGLPDPSSSCPTRTPPPHRHWQGPARDIPEVHKLRDEIPTAAAPGGAADGV